MRYKVIVTYIDGDNKYQNETNEYDDFSEAMEEFNFNCAVIFGSTMLLDIKNETVIRQYVRKGDVVVLK